MDKDITSLIGVSILPETYLKVVQEILKREEDEKFTQLFIKFKEINKIPTEHWEIPEKLSTKDTLPLYVMGLIPSEIAHLRNVTRQTESLRLRFDFENLYRTDFKSFNEEELRQLHLDNRVKFKKLIVNATVLLVTETKDISLMKTILNSRYKTKRSYYATYVKLGGDPYAFKIYEMDNRYSNVENQFLKEVFNLFEEGLTNLEVSDKLGINKTKVPYLRRKYEKIKYPLRSL